MNSHEELIERLNSKRFVRERWVEPVGTMDEPCDADDDGAEAILRNPDGPEAAQAIRTLLDEIARKDVALRLVKRIAEPLIQLDDVWEDATHIISAIDAALESSP